MNLAKWLLAGSLCVAGAAAYATEEKTPEEAQQMTRCENVGKAFPADIAIEGCTKIIDSGKWTGKNLARAYNGRGIAYADKQDYQHALADYDEAIKADPKDPRGYNNRCVTFNSKNESDLALAECNHAIQLDPKLARAYNNRGVAYYHKQDYDRALADYNKAIQLDPDYAPTYQKRALVYDDKQDYDHAISDYNQAYDRDPTDAYVVIWRYVARTRNGQNGQAELTSSAAKLNHSLWPFPVVELFMGSKTNTDILSAANNPGAQCEAQFYIGEWQLLKKAPGPAATLLHNASETCPKDFVEYSRAVAELKHLPQ